VDVRKRKLSIGADGLPIGWKVVARNGEYAMVVLPAYDLVRLKQLRIFLDAGRIEEEEGHEIGLRKRAKLRAKQGKLL